MGKTKVIDIPIDIVLEREVYYDNRHARLQEFRDCLKETKNKFAVASAIRVILEQEQFIAHIVKNGHKVAKPKDEERFLTQLVEEAKAVFGQNYEKIKTEIDNESKDK